MTKEKRKGQRKDRGELDELMSQLKKDEAAEALGFARSIINKRKK